MNAPKSNIVRLPDRRAKSATSSTGCARALHDALAEEFATALARLNLKDNEGNDVDVHLIAAGLADMVLPVTDLQGGR